MNATARREAWTDRCEHGLSGAVDDQGNPRCPLCRREMGLLIPAPRSAHVARPGRCRQPGHEPYPARGCRACASEVAACREPAHRPDPDAPLHRANALNDPEENR